MDKDLLKWAVENSTDSAKPLDPEKTAFLRAALGPSDAEMMRVAVSCITNPDDTVENKLIAMDNLELLVENIDNANDVERLGLWSKFLTTLNSDNPDLVLYALWIIGTASQNNAEVQDTLSNKHAVIGIVLDLIRHPDDRVKKKALYALSSILGQNRNSVHLFKELDGLQKLHALLDHNVLSERVRYIIEKVINSPL